MIQSSNFDLLRKFGVLETRLIHSQLFSEELGADVYLKLESEQTTGSFKLRGAANKIAKFSNPPKKVITCSTGNHGLGVAHAAKAVGIEAEIWMQSNVPIDRKNRITKAGGKLVLVDSESCALVEKLARESANEPESVYISPYNDPDVIEGQSSVGSEIVNQLDKPVDMVFASVGGGGLISGVASAVKSSNPLCQIIGVQPRNDAQMFHSIIANEVIEKYPREATLSVATAGTNERNTITFPMLQALVDDWSLVEESDIETALWRIMRDHKLIVEGAAACALAGLFKFPREQIQGKTCVVVVCGSNVGMNIVREIVNKHS